MVSLRVLLVYIAKWKDSAHQANSTRSTPVHESVTLFHEAFELTFSPDTYAYSNRFDDIVKSSLTDEAEHEDVESEEQQIFETFGVSNDSIIFFWLQW